MKTSFSVQLTTFTFDHKIFFMQFPSPVPAQWIAGFISAEILGNRESSATGINEIHNAGAGDIVFVDHPKYYDSCLKSAATFIIINKKTEAPDGKTLFITDDPFEAYAKIVQHFRPFMTSGSPAFLWREKVGQSRGKLPSNFGRRIGGCLAT